MEASIPFYPLVVVPVVAAIVAFWRRGRWHLAVLRSGRPLDRTSRPFERIKALGVFVFGQRRLLQDLGPGLTHAFVFWGFVVLLATTGNYITNGLVETIVGWPLGGFFWSIVVDLRERLRRARARIGHLLRRSAESSCGPLGSRSPATRS